MDYHEFNQVLSLLVAAGPEMDALLEQINTSPGT